MDNPNRQAEPYIPGHLRLVTHPSMLYVVIHRNQGNASISSPGDGLSLPCRRRHHLDTASCGIVKGVYAATLLSVGFVPYVGCAVVTGAPVTLTSNR